MDFYKFKFDVRSQAVHAQVPDPLRGKRSARGFQDIRSGWLGIDLDTGNSFVTQQFDQILKTLGQTLQEDELKMIVSQIDKDGNGFIDFHEFLELVAPKMIANRSERVYLEAFKVIDDSDDGLLSLEELMRANFIAGAGLSQQELEQILAYVDYHHQGKFNFSNVLKMLYRTPT